MIERSNNKIPLRRPKRKSGLSIFNSKFQDDLKKNALHIRGTKIHTKNSGGVSESDSPKRPGEGKFEFDEFVDNVVSNFLEKTCPDKAINRPINVISASPDNENLKNLKQINNVSEENVFIKKLTLSGPKNSDWNPQIKTRSNGSFGRIKNQNGKHRQVKYLPKSESSVTLKRTKGHEENYPLLLGNEKYTPFNCNMEEFSQEPTNEIVKPKRRKPSEIPLRKSRIDSSRGPKPVSVWLKKTFKDEESSVDFHSEKKIFSPIHEADLCSELLITIDGVSDSQNVDSTEKKPPQSPNPPVFETQEKVFNFEPERSSEPPNIVQDFLKVKPSVRRVKKLDLEKVKTSSFTVLQSDPSVRNRLEYLHKQNVLNKKKVNTVNQKKSKPLISKQFLTSVKKTSKRSLSPSLIGIRNKSNLRVKLKRSKNLFLEKLHSPKLTEADWKILSEFLSGKKLNLISNYRETSTSSVKIAKPKRHLSKKEISKSLREKLAKWDQTFLHKIQNPTKRVSKIPKPKKRAHSKDFGSKLPQGSAIPENLKSTSFSTNSAANVKKVECFGYTKSKITRPSIPPLSPPSPIPLPLLPPSLLFLVPDQDEKLSLCENDEQNINKLEDDKIATEEPQDERTLSEKEEHALNVKATALKLENKESFVRIKSKGKVKEHLKMDTTLEKEDEEVSKKINSCDCLFKNDIIEASMELPKLKNVKSSFNDFSSSEKFQETEKLENSDPSLILIENNSGIDENLKSNLSKQKRFSDKTSTSKKKENKKKNRSEAGDRRLPPGNHFFPSDFPLQGKIKVDHKARNSLKKPCNKEDPTEFGEFEEEAFIRLKRRNSEPTSHSDYIWKRSTLPIFRGHKASVSSVASSLKHLNTDDFDDFIFWEPLPQKKASCWEMSLYQFKKPWSVLSCAVFKENRLPDTPGFILENLRNGGNINQGFDRPSDAGNKEILSCTKGNPFDVEPSIAQKNIDIRNWLAALNFPTPSSNSPNLISEGNFTSQLIADPQSLNKVVTPKRRKVFRSSKLSDKSSKIVVKEKNQCVRVMRSSKEDLKSVVRKKSGVFVISDRFSRSAEEKSIFSKTNDRNTLSEVFTKPELMYEFETAETGTRVDETFSHSRRSVEHQQSKIVKKSNFCEIPKETLTVYTFDTLVTFFLFIVVISFVLLIVYPIVSVDFMHY